MSTSLPAWRNRVADVSRLNQEVAATNAILLAMVRMRPKHSAVSVLHRLPRAKNLIDLAGGLDKLSSKTQAYCGGFTRPTSSCSARPNRRRKPSIAGFADLGKSVPASKLAFRELIESQDLSTEAGRKLFNSLLDLSDEFDIVAKRSDFLAGLTTAARITGSIFDTFASDAQKLEAARRSSTTHLPVSANGAGQRRAFLSLAQSIDQPPSGRA